MLNWFGILLDYGKRPCTKPPKRPRGGMERLEDRHMLSAGSTVVPTDFQNSFDDALAVAESGPAQNIGLTYTDGGIEVGSGDRISFATAGNLDGMKGRISFRFKPNWNGATDTQTRSLFDAGPLQIVKENNGSSNYLVFRLDDAQGNLRSVSTLSLEPVVQSWLAGTWYDIEVEWNLTLSPGQQTLKMTIDGINAVTTTDTWNQVQTLATNFTVGTDSNFGQNADGVFDELLIYDEPEAANYVLPSFRAPLESVASAINSGAVEFSGLSTISGEVGNAIRVDATDRLSFPTAGNLDKDQGTISFRFKPDWNGANDTLRRYFVSAGFPFRIFKHYNPDLDLNYLVIRFDDAQGNQFELSSTANDPHDIESWIAGQWYTIDVFWDFTGAQGRIGFSIDGMFTIATSFAFSGVPNFPTNFNVGANSSFGQQGNGTFDELKIYDESLWDFDSPVDSYIRLTKNNGQWEPHETIRDSFDAPVLNGSVLPLEDHLFYEKDTFERVYAGTVPEANEIVDGIQKDNIEYSIAQDEYETLFFNLYSRQNLSGATLSFSDFTSGSTVLNDAEIKVVKNWWQAGLDSKKTVIPQFVPELLLSDDVSGDAGVLSDPDAISAENWDAQNLPSFANLPEVNTNIESFTSKQFAITINASEGTPAGTYTSTVSLKDNNGQVVKTLVLSLEVLPFQLLDSGKDYLYYQRALLDTESPGNSDAVSLARYTKQVEDLAKQGINGLLVYGSTSAANVAGPLTTKINIIKNAGIDGKVFFTSLTVEARDLLIANGYEAFAYGVDEPNNNARIVQHINKSDDIRDLGGKVITAINQDWADRLNDINDPIYSLPGLDTFDLQDGTGTLQAEPLDYRNLLLSNAKDYINDLANGIQTSSQPTSYYWQSLQELPAVNRSLAGFYLWNTGLDGVFPYVYQHIDGNPYYDFDNWVLTNGTFRDHLTTYPSQEGPVSTIQWEAFREGIDDVRYLQTWTHQYYQLLSLDPAAATSSKATIDAMLNKYKDRDSLDDISPETFADDRATLKNEITSMLTSISLATGDFDQDGDVDGSDFLSWQRNTSIGNLTDWEANYGTGDPLASSTALASATISDENVAPENSVLTASPSSLPTETLPGIVDLSPSLGSGSQSEAFVDIAAARWYSFKSNSSASSEHFLQETAIQYIDSATVDHGVVVNDLDKSTPWEDLEFEPTHAAVNELLSAIADHQLHDNDRFLWQIASATDQAALSLLTDQEWK